MATQKCTEAYFALLVSLYVPIALTVFFGVRYISRKQLANTLQVGHLSAFYVKFRFAQSFQMIVIP